MVTIRYNLTPEDFAAFELERRGGLGRRILRIAAGVFLGVVGLIFVWQAFFSFPWNQWSGKLAIAALGLFFLWIGFELPGVSWLLRRFSNPYAECEIQVFDGKIVCSERGRTEQFRWLPRRGFKENGKYFFLRAFGSEASWTIPKRAVAPEQERDLRDLVEEKPERGDAVECRFFLTQDELNEASAAFRRGIVQHWLMTKSGKVIGRAICGLGAMWLLWLPGHIGRSWVEEFRTDPGANTFLLGLVLLTLFAAAGCPGLMALNRLDLQRRIRISDRDVEETRGAKTSIHKWKRFFYYHETQNLFVLRRLIVVLILTIPKRSLQPGDEEKLRALLDRKLPKQ